MAATILIADDSKMVRTMVRAALEADQHHVIDVSDGRAALAALRVTPTDLVITDVNMPEMDGLALVRSIRGDERYRFTPILVLTTESSDAIKQRGREAGATGWLVKPFDADRLRRTVVHVLKRRAS